MHNKRGDTVTFWPLIEAIIITMFIIATFNFIRSIEDDTLFERQYLARDIALTANAINGISGTVNYEYYSNVNLSQYKYTFTDFVTITEGDGLGVRYPTYYNSHLSDKRDDLDHPKKLIFARTSSSFVIADDIKTEQTKACPEIDTSGTVKVVMVDPADDSSYSIAQDIQNMPGKFITTLTRGSKPELVEVRLDKISEDTDVVIALVKSTENRVLVSVNNEQQSQKLGCLIISGFERIDRTIARSLPSGELMINKNTKGIGIMVMYQEPKEVASIISDALRKYNG